MEWKTRSEGTGATDTDTDTNSDTDTVDDTESDTVPNPVVDECISSEQCRTELYPELHPTYGNGLDCEPYGGAMVCMCLEEPCAPITEVDTNTNQDTDTDSDSNTDMDTDRGTGTCTPRNPYLHPFAIDSIWNMPIHGNARYVDAGIGKPTAWGVTIDEEDIILDPDAPLVNIYKNSWATDQRCTNVSGYMTQAPLPDGWMFPAYSGNGCAAVLDSDGVTLRQFQSLHRCATSGDAYALVEYPSENIFGDGIEGAHGGSGLSSIGGSIRIGDMTPAGDIFNDPDTYIPHVLKINVYARLYLQYTGS